MGSNQRTNCSFFWESSEESKIPFDSFTAASSGDLSFFTSHSVGSIEEFSTANKSGWTPIMYACSKGHAILVSYMIMCGVKTNCTTKSKVTPLMISMASGDLATVECVFNPNDMESKDYRQWTPLFYAVHFMQEKCVEFLLKNGANVNVEDFQKETPLILAIKSGNEAIVNLLLETATNLDTVSYKNESAVMLAKESVNARIREKVLIRNEFLKSSRGHNFPLENVTPKKGLRSPKTDIISTVARSPILKNVKNRSFLGLKMSKSVSYSPNKTRDTKTDKSSSQYNSPSHLAPDSSKTSFWKMCLLKTAVPTTVHYDVESLLNSLGLERYWPNFRDEEVDFETLLTFSELDLKEIGITFFGPRKKILSAIQQLRLFYDKN